MGFSFKKSIKIGGARINIGKKSASISTGVKGFSVNAGTNGTRLNAGRGGVRYTTKIGGSSRKNKSYTKNEVGELTPLELLYGGIILFVIGIIISFIWLKLGLWVVGFSLIYIVVAFVIYKIFGDEKEEADDINYFEEKRELSLKDEVLREIEKSGKRGILQTELLEKYYSENPTKNTLYQTIKKLEDDFEIYKIKEGRTYRIKKFGF